MAEEYSRTINYIQVPIFAHLAWGREVSGCNFFFQAVFRHHPFQF